MKTKEKNRTLLRMSLLLYQQLLSQQSSDQNLRTSVDSIRDSAGALERTWKRLQLARQHGFVLSTAVLQDGVRRQIAFLENLVTQITSQGRLDAPSQPPSLSNIVLDLRQLNEEFDEVRFDLKGQRITVHTDPIVLDDVHLGSFAIELKICHLSAKVDSSVFECIALDPNPAQGDSDVTHPHVKDRCLCAGDAAAAIASALWQGRIADAFCLVGSVLHTYNRESPYVALEDWSGVRCADCDETVGRDDRPLRDPQVRRDV